MMTPHAGPGRTARILTRASVSDAGLRRLCGRAQDWMKWLAQASPPSKFSRKHRVLQMDSCPPDALLASPANRPSRRPVPRTIAVQGLLGSGASGSERTLAVPIGSRVKGLVSSSTR